MTDRASGERLFVSTPRISAPKISKVRQAAHVAAVALGVGSALLAGALVVLERLAGIGWTGLDALLANSNPELGHADAWLAAAIVKQVLACTMFAAVCSTEIGCPVHARRWSRAAGGVVAASILMLIAREEIVAAATIGAGHSYAASSTLTSLSPAGVAALVVWGLVLFNDTRSERLLVAR